MVKCCRFHMFSKYKTSSFNIPVIRISFNLGEKKKIFVYKSPENSQNLYRVNDNMGFQARLLKLTFIMHRFLVLRIYCCYSSFYMAKFVWLANSYIMHRYIEGMDKIMEILQILYTFISWQWFCESDGTTAMVLLSQPHGPKKNSAITTKYPIPHKIYWNRIPTQNVDRPHLAIRILRIDTT
jgi:hypothetical protein